MLFLFVILLVAFLNYEFLCHLRVLFHVAGVHLVSFCLAVGEVWRWSSKGILSRRSSAR